MKQICVCGHFAFGKMLLNGQTIKTKIVTDELVRVFGEEQVKKLDTHGGMRALIKLPFQLLVAMFTCRNIVILPAYNGLRILTPLLSLYHHIFKRKLHYVVIGGWLANFIGNKKTLIKQLKRFHNIYVETSTMKMALEKLDFNNVVVMPNCKELHIPDEFEPDFLEHEPYKLCTFSRVMKEKGLEDAISAVKAVNEVKGRTVYELDIYGPVDSEQIEWFHTIQKAFPEYVRYCGEVPFDESVVVLKNYFALLFPTKFYTEGIPGTIIDAYAAGVPVIASRWESFCDLIDDGVTGIGYDFGDVTHLEQTLLYIAEHSDAVYNMKRACIKKAKQFTPEAAMQPLIRSVS